jgi:YD repeat-containing protein
MLPVYGNGRLVGYNCIIQAPAGGTYVVLAAPTSCPSGYNVDASSPSGCSQFTPPDPRYLGQPRTTTGCNCQEGNPINIVVGNKVEVVTDYQSPGPDKLAFTRQYNAMASLFSSLGFGWQSNFDSQIQFNGSTPSSTTGFYIVRPDGAWHWYQKSSGVWSSYYSDIDGALTTDGSTVWTYTDTEDTVETYDFTTGRLMSRRTRSGYQQTLSYDAGGHLASVTDSLGRTLRFTFANGVLQSMTDPDGGVHTYSYNSVGQFAPDELSQVTYPGATPGPTVQYLYENATYPYALTGIVDENGARIASWTYDANMHAVSSQHAGGADNTVIAYNLTGIGGAGTSTVTTPPRRAEDLYLELGCRAPAHH